MANWEKLNKEFYAVLDSLTDIQWQEWMDTRAAKKAMRELDLKIKALNSHPITNDRNDWEKVQIENLQDISCGFTNRMNINAEPPASGYSDALAA
jgi:hypothetical protein